MNTQQRQRQRQADNSRHAPHAGAPNWLIVVVAGAITAAALVARAFV